MKKTNIDDYNVIWNSMSEDASGQMPIGNGDIGAGVYVLKDQGLYLLLSKNDALTYCGDIFKTGRVHISITPNPFKRENDFCQILDLRTGCIRINVGKVNIKIWADMNAPVFHVEIDAPEEITVTVRPEFWKRFDACLANQIQPEEKEGKFPVEDRQINVNNQMIWYYAVGNRSIYPSDLKYYDIEDMADRYPDPFRYNTFGCMIFDKKMQLNEKSLVGTGQKFDLKIVSLALQCADSKIWIQSIQKLGKQAINFTKSWERHCQWWDEFWNRGWIKITDNRIEPSNQGVLYGEAPNGIRIEKDTGALVAQSYQMYRFLMACQSRGKMPVKFNGGIFTQPLHCTEKPAHCHLRELPDGTFLTHEDDRSWGRRFTFQNQRLLYWPMLMSGDYDLMLPFFEYYLRMLEIRQAITKKWFGHEGAYYRENIEMTGAERDCGEEGKPLKTRSGGNIGQGYFHSYYFTSGLELLAMLIEYYDHTRDSRFLMEKLVPYAKQILLFYEKHYPREADGKLRLDPSMVLETWWIAVNPATDLAGLRYCIQRLLLFPQIENKDKENWKALYEIIPEIPYRMEDGVKIIAPAEYYEKKTNRENGELYPVFPFRLFGIANGTGELVHNTMEHRTAVDAFGGKCWTQDQIHWAYAGDAKNAADGLIRRFRIASTECRFPLYGSAKPDSCPDFDHFGSGAIALQSMLVQETEECIYLLPAWPDYWDVEFKLHLEKGTEVSGKVQGGSLLWYRILPVNQKKEVKVMQPQRQ